MGIIKKIRAFLIILIIISVICCAVFFLYSKSIDKQIKSLICEAEVVPAYVYNENLFLNENVLDFKEILYKNNIDGNLKEVLLVDKDIIWFLYTDETNIYNLNIATVDIYGNNLSLKYARELYNSIINNIQPSRTDKRYRDNYYLDTDVFYNNGKIILNDCTVMIEYDIQTGVAEEIPVAKYIYPESPLTIQMEDNKKIHLSNKLLTQTIDINYNSDSVAFKKMTSLNDKKTWEGISCLRYCFDNVQIANDLVYITCRVLNWSGETYAVVYQYDYNKNELKYVFNLFTQDVITTNLYIVETY